MASKWYTVDLAENCPVCLEPSFTVIKNCCHVLCQRCYNNIERGPAMKRKCPLCRASLLTGSFSSTSTSSNFYFEKTRLEQRISGLEAMNKELSTRKQFYETAPDKPLKTINVEVECLTAPIIAKQWAKLEELEADFKYDISFFHNRFVEVHSRRVQVIHAVSNGVLDVISQVQELQDEILSLRDSCWESMPVDQKELDRMQKRVSELEREDHVSKRALAEISSLTTKNEILRLQVVDMQVDADFVQSEMASLLKEFERDSNVAATLQVLVDGHNDLLKDYDTIITRLKDEKADLQRRVETKTSEIDNLRIDLRALGIKYLELNKTIAESALKEKQRKDRRFLSRVAMCFGRSNRVDVGDLASGS